MTNQMRTNQIMTNQIMVFKQEQADKIAETYFTLMCGFDRPGEKFKGMLKEGLVIRDKMAGSFQIRAVVSSFGPEAVHARTIEVGGLTFTCNAISQLELGAISEIHAFILTIGRLDFDSPSVIDLFYADTWGTAYVDAGRDLIREWIQEQIPPDENKIVSDSFGPGYYGMDLSQLQYFYKLLDADKIGVELNGNSMMLPQKSCAGFFFSMSGDSKLPSDDCKSCLAEKAGCNFCRNRITKAEL